MTLTSRVMTIVTWLRAGYPEGVPENVRRVAARLAAAGWPLSGLEAISSNEETAQAPS